MIKLVTVLVLVIAISARPLVKHLMWRLSSDLDEIVGNIPILSTEELSSFVKGSKLQDEYELHTFAIFF